MRHHVKAAAHTAGGIMIACSHNIIRQNNQGVNYDERYAKRAAV